MSKGLISNLCLKSNHVSNVSAEIVFKLYLRESKTVNLGLGQLGHLGQILDKHFLKIILFTKKISTYSYIRYTFYPQDNLGWEDQKTALLISNWLH